MADQRIVYTEEMVGAGHPTKTDTLNRLALVEHATDGTHDTVTLNKQTSAPSTTSDQGAVYTKVIDSAAELFYRADSDGDETQLTSGGALNISGGGAGHGLMPAGKLTACRTAATVTVSAAQSTNDFGYYLYLSGAGTASYSASGGQSSDGGKVILSNVVDAGISLGWKWGQNGLVAGVADLDALRGQTITMFARVDTSTTDRVRLRASSNGEASWTTGGYHTGSGVFETLTVTHTVSAAATNLSLYATIEVGTAITATVELLCLVIGSSCDTWVPWAGARQSYAHGANITGTGNTAITGAGFSPHQADCYSIANSDSSSHFGHATMGGSTITQMCAGASGADNTRLIRSGVLGTLTSFDSDGATFNIATHNSNSAVIIVLRGGDLP